jgi:hypothetical protein
MSAQRWLEQLVADLRNDLRRLANIFHPADGTSPSATAREDRPKLEDTEETMEMDAQNATTSSVDNRPVLNASHSDVQHLLQQREKTVRQPSYIFRIAVVLHVLIFAFGLSFFNWIWKPIPAPLFVLCLGSLIAALIAAPFTVWIKGGRATVLDILLSILLILWAFFIIPLLSSSFKATTDVLNIGHPPTPGSTLCMCASSDAYIATGNSQDRVLYRASDRLR